MKQVKWLIPFSSAYTDKLNMDYCSLILQVSNKLVELQHFNRFSFAFHLKNKGNQQRHPQRCSGEFFFYIFE